MKLSEFGRLHQSMGDFSPTTYIEGNGAEDVAQLYGVVPKGLFSFLGFFRQCGVLSLLGTSGIYLGTYSLGLFAGLFSDVMGYCLPIVSCEMTRTK